MRPPSAWPLSWTSLIASDAPAFDTYTTLYFLLLPYSLFRWGFGREAVAGLAIILVLATMASLVSWTGVADAIGGVAVLVSAFAPGWAVRSQHGAGERRLEQVKSEERALLARELDDTVARHVPRRALADRSDRCHLGGKPGGWEDERCQESCTEGSERCDSTSREVCAHGAATGCSAS